ncbi:hypothetical protein GQ42DRAFT_161181 [Ramicandelaber brevisporus]|nr:hypothetical protein GQ42DRAFT_161181 [Ramicandelaber brevisporus]
MSAPAAASAAPVASDATVQRPDNEQQRQEDDSATGCSVSETAFNLLNTICGSGLLGLPFALREGGFWFTAFAILVSPYVANFGLYVLIKAGARKGIFDFPQLALTTTGRAGQQFLNFAVLVSCIGCTLSYLIIAGDVLPPLVTQYLPGYFYDYVYTREFAILASAIGFVLPLLFFRTLAPLASASIVSVLCLPVILLLVAVRGPLHAADHPHTYRTFGDRIFSALAMVSFSFVSSQSAFPIFVTMADRTPSSWFKATTLATTGAVLVSLTFAVIGYISFGDDIMANLFKNFPLDDVYINVARFLLALELLLTYPMLFYPARTLILSSIGFESSERQSSQNVHIVSTVILFILTVFGAINITDLGLVFKVIGAVAASALAFICPAVVYLAVYGVSVGGRKPLQPASSEDEANTATDYSETEDAPLLNQQGEATPESGLDVEAARARRLKLRNGSLFLLSFGVLIFTTGTWASLQEILAKN